MCGGVSFQLDRQPVKTFFPNPKARLPVLGRDGSIIMLPWGRRENQSGGAPQGGWARLESIHEGRWERYQPQPVKIVVDAFMEKDGVGNSRWFSIPEGLYIQGLVAQDGGFTRLYVVTTEDNMSCHSSGRWPRTVGRAENSAIEEIKAPAAPKEETSAQSSLF